MGDDAQRDRAASLIDRRRRVQNDGGGDKKRRKKGGTGVEVILLRSCGCQDRISHQDVLCFSFAIATEMSSRSRNSKGSSSTASPRKANERRGQTHAETSNVADGQPSSLNSKRGRDVEGDDDKGKRTMKSIPRPPNAWILYRSAKSKEYSNRPLSFFPAAPSKISSDDAASKSDRATSSSTNYDKNRRNLGFVNQQGMSKMISDMWKTESQEIREHWRKVAEERKRQHMQMYPHYRFTPTRAEGVMNKSKKEEGPDTVERQKTANDADKQTCTSAATMETASKLESTSIMKRAKNHQARLRSKTLSISSSNRGTKRVDRSTWTETPFESPVLDDAGAAAAVVDQQEFSLDKLDWLPSDDGYLDQILSAISSAEQAESNKPLCVATPTTPEMLHVEQSRSNEDERRETEAALEALSAWQEVGFGNHDFAGHSHDFSLHATDFSLSNAAASYHPPADDRSSNAACDPRSASSLGDFTFAFDSLWHQPDASWGTEAVELDDKTIGKSSDQFDFLTEISSAFLQSNFTESES